MIWFKRSLVSCSDGILFYFSLRDSASTLSIFRPGSTSPSAILYDAWESFTQRLPKADESIRSIRPELAAAVDECIDAAGQEWEPFWQRRLLNVKFPIRSNLLFNLSDHFLPRRPNLDVVFLTYTILLTLSTWDKLSKF